MGDLMGSLVWGAKSGNIVLLGVGRYTLVVRKAIRKMVDNLGG
jgi:hypothetical protein